MKILIGVDKGSYTFNATGQSVTLSGIPILDIKQVLLITNLTTNEIIYSPVIVGKGGTISNNVISLVYNTTSMNNTDILQIFVHLSDNIKMDFNHDDPTFDSFGRLKISSPNTIFQSALNNTPGNVIWELITSNGATSSYLTNSSTYLLTVSGTTGSRAMREQHGYNYYTPGKSQTIFMSTVFGASESGLTRRVGYYNDTDGIYFEQKDGVMYACLRTSVSGSIVENRFTQSNWNVDKLDGSYIDNKSGILFDPNKVQIVFFDFQWLGAGRIRYGFDIDGDAVVVHNILNANIIDNTYMTSGTLPLRYEILRTLTTGVTASLTQICSTVISGGGDINEARSTSISMGGISRTISSGVRNALLSVRVRTLTPNGRINRISAKPLSIHVMTTSNSSVLVEVVLQRSNLLETNLGGTPTWNTQSGSLLEYSNDGTTVTGGTILKTFYISAQSRDASIDLISHDDFITLNSSGSQSDYLHLVVTPLGANSTLYAGINLIETR